MIESTQQSRTKEVELPADAATREAVTGFLETCPAFHYRQTFDWIYSQGLESFRLFVTSNKNHITAVSFVETCKSRLWGLDSSQIVRGPVFDSADSVCPHLEDVVRLLGKRPATLRINPFQPTNGSSLSFGDSWTVCDRTRHYKDTLIVPILDTEGEQWRSLRRSTRTAINRSKAAGVRVTRASTIQEFRNFAKSYTAFASKKGILGLADDLGERIYEQFNNEQRCRAILLSAMKDSQPLGEILLMQNAGSLVYEWGWSAPFEARGKIPVMHELIWEALNVCRQNNISEFDLGGYWTERGNDDSINHFKLGFTKNVRSYMPEYERTLSATKALAKNVVHRISYIARRFFE